MTRHGSSARRLLATLAVVAFAAAACGGDDDDGTATTAAASAETTTAAEVTTTVADAATTTAAATATSAAPATTAGGGTATSAPSGGAAGCENGTTDPTDLSVGRQPARCDPGYPEPQPLAERAKIVFANAFISEYVAPFILADSLGEFDKENLDVEIVNLSFEDALPQLATGTVDAINGAPSLAFYNAHASGVDVDWVLGNFFPPNAGDTSVPQTGLWARASVFSDPSNPDPKELEGHKVASAVGLASVISYPLSQAFSSAGADPTKMEYVQIPSADMATALENGAVDAAWMLDPFWTQFADNDDYVLVATQTPGEPIGGIFFGDRLLNQEREVGEAFARALIRTINTYLDGNYHDDPVVMAQIADITGITVEQMTRTPSLLFDWEIRDGTTTRAQEAFIGYALLTSVIPEEELVDRDFYLTAVGAE